MDELNDTLELSQRSTVAKEDSVNSRSWSYRRSRLANPYDLDESYSPSIQVRARHSGSSYMLSVLTYCRRSGAYILSSYKYIQA